MLIIRQSFTIAHTYDWLVSVINTKLQHNLSCYCAMDMIQIMVDSIGNETFQTEIGGTRVGSVNLIQ